MSYPPGGYGGYQQQPGYGPPGYGGGYGGQVEHPQGTTILVLGILSIVTCQILGPFAWSMGNKALEEIDRDPMRYSNRGSINAGRICGIVGSVLLGLYLLMVVGIIIVNIAVLGASSSS
jgi:hypothetical protein